MTARFSLRFAVLAAFCGQAMAVSTEGDDIPYAAGMGSYTIVDSERSWNDDYGFQLNFGLPLEWEETALEFSIFGGRVERDIDGRDDANTGIMVDLVRDLGGMRFLSGSDFTPFALAGVGAVREDVLGDKSVRPLINIGGGALIGLPWHGIGLRTELRLTGQHKSDSAPDTNLVLDYRFLIGLQVPLTPFFATDLPESRERQALDAAECDVAVVDSVTGRTDCRSDTDGDGIDDTQDRCPSTAPGIPVDAEGCPDQTVKSADADGDGVVDAGDQCPATYPGVTVNISGCAEPQPLVIPQLGFMSDSKQLTAEADQALERVHAMLAAQSELTMEIIGHTDDSGDQDHDQALSEARARIVKDRLVMLGIDGSRLDIVGRGASQPVADNDTEAGREANRRVAFWLYVD